MMQFLTLCLVSFVIVPTHAQQVNSNNWPPSPSVVPTSTPTVLPTSSPTPTSTPNPCPPGTVPCGFLCCPPGEGEGEGGNGHGHKNHANIHTDIAIGHFTINVGKIDVDIEKGEKKDSHSGPGSGSIPGIPIPIGSAAAPSLPVSSTHDDEDVVSNTIHSLTSIPTSGPIMGGGNAHGNKNKPNIDTDIRISDFTINVGKIKVDVNKCKNEGHSKPTWPIITPLGNDTIQFPDDPVSTEPSSEEIVLGESDVSTQGLPPVGGVSTTPVIYSFTYKISTEKKVQVDTTKPLQQVVTFIIRGTHFDISSLLGVDGADLEDGLASLLEPKVFLGSIPLKVVRFTDTYIEARFEDIDDQKSFKAGSYLVRVKVLHVGHKIGILSTDGSSSELSTLGGLSLPELGIIGSGLPVLPVIKTPPPIKSPFSLISLFAGLQFDVASLTVTFCSSDADKIAKAAKVLY